MPASVCLLCRRTMRLLPALGHELGQAVVDEPLVGLWTCARDHRCGYHGSPNSSRVRDTSSVIVSTSASTPSNFTIPRIRASKETSTSSS